MLPDAITDEICEIRHRLAARFDNDVERIGDDLRRREAASGHRVVQPATAGNAHFDHVPDREVSARRLG